MQLEQRMCTREKEREMDRKRCVKLSRIGEWGGEMGGMKTHREGKDGAHGNA